MTWPPRLTLRRRVIRVLTSTGRWEFMRVVEASPFHLLVEDATGQRFLTGRSTMHTRGD